MKGMDFAVFPKNCWREISITLIDGIVSVIAFITHTCVEHHRRPTRDARQ
jgi:hypothetical protein